MANDLETGWLVWDGNGRFWRQADNDGGQWVATVAEGTMFKTRQDAAEFADEVGGYCVASGMAVRIVHYLAMPTGNTAAEGDERAKRRAVLVGDWEGKRKEQEDAQKRLIEAQRLFEAAKQNAEAAADDLGAFLADLSHQDAGTVLPSGNKNPFVGHMIHRGGLYVVKSIGWRVDANGYTTNQIAYEIERVGGSVFDIDAGIHSHPKAGG